jgi:hypothetical protein
VVSQRRKAQHAQLVQLERETGSEESLLPEFWEEDESAGAPRTGRLLEDPGNEDMVMMEGIEEDEEERWAREAAEAEEAEFEAEEFELARRIEESITTNGLSKADWSSAFGDAGYLQDVEAMDVE